MQLYEVPESLNTHAHLVPGGQAWWVALLVSGRRVGKRGGCIGLSQLASHVKMKTVIKRCNNSSLLLKKNGTAVLATKMGAANSARVDPGGIFETAFLRAEKNYR